MFWSLKQFSSGIPSSPPYGSYVGNGPTGSVGDLPITANFINKNQRMNLKTIAIISLSAFVLLLVFIGAVSIFLKWRKVRRPSNAVGPAFTPSANKRSGKFMNYYVDASTQMQCRQMFLNFLC